MDKEHTKYVRATVTRLNYLLSGESDTKGLALKLLNRYVRRARIMMRCWQRSGEKMNLSLLEILSEKSLYKRRKAEEILSARWSRMKRLRTLTRKMC